MTVYYVDPAGSNTAPYDTWAKSAQALATVVAIPPAVTDIIYCRTHEHIAAEIDLASSGTNAGGWIKLIGCNAAGAVDGTRYILDGDAAGIHIFDFNTQDMWWLENIEVINTGGSAKHGFYSNAITAQGNVFINCCANNCSGTGFSLGANFYASLLLRCISYSNGANGFSRADRSFFCCARDNTGIGFNDIRYFHYGCISHGNTDDGFSPLEEDGVLINCVTDGNTDDGIVLGSSTSLYFAAIIGCRITNQSGAGDIGLLTINEPCIVGWSYFEDNSNLNIQGVVPTTSGSLVVGITYEINTYVSDDDFTNVGAASNATGVIFVATGTTPTHWAHASTLSNAPNATFQFIPIENGTTTTNLEDLANTNEGYAQAVANNNFATGYTDSGDPDLRRTKITIPWS